MKHTLFTALASFFVCIAYSQNSVHTENFSANCSSDFWTINQSGHIQQWNLSNGTIQGGDTILSGGGESLSYCGTMNAPTFFTAGGSEPEVRYYDSNSGWTSIPNFFAYDMLGGNQNHHYATLVGAVIQQLTYWDGTQLAVIDSLHGEFFAGVWDIAVDTSSHAWIFTASSPGYSIDSLKVYNQNGKVNSYSFTDTLDAYGSFFLNDTLYVGTSQDSIFPILISGSIAQLGGGIAFPNTSFTDMASCQGAGTSSSVVDFTSTELKVFPNPTADYLTIPSGIKKQNIKIYNASGQQIELQLIGNTVDLSEQPSGMYFLEINSKNSLNTYKVMKF